MLWLQILILESAMLFGASALPALVLTLSDKESSVKFGSLVGGFS